MAWAWRQYRTQTSFCICDQNLKMSFVLGHKDSVRDVVRSIAWSGNVTASEECSNLCGQFGSSDSSSARNCFLKTLAASAIATYIGFSGRGPPPPESYVDVGVSVIRVVPINLFGGNLLCISPPTSFRCSAMSSGGDA